MTVLRSRSRISPVQWVRCLTLGAFAAVLACLASMPASAEPGAYTLGPQDKLRLRVFEWREALDKVFEWSALNGEFIVSEAGTLSLPLIGGIEARGRTTKELAQAIGERLKTRIKLGAAPEVGLEIVEYRPFYIVGRVAKPGAYPYRPGMNVLHALSVAGGFPRPQEDSFLRLGREVISGRGTVDQLELKIKELLARKARLKAELAQIDKIAFPERLESDDVDPVTARILEQERIVFNARRTALRTQINTLKRLKTYLVEEVKSLREQVKLKEHELSIVNGELNNVSDLVKKGLSIASRQFALERLAAQLSSDKLRLSTALLKAQQEISRTEVSIDEARNKNSIEVASQLRETEAKLEQTMKQYDTQQNLLYESEFTFPRLVASRRQNVKEIEPIYTIVRSAENGEAREIKATEQTAVRPGDTVKVELPLQDSLSTILGISSSASQ